MEQKNTFENISIQSLDTIDLSTLPPIDLSWLNNSMDNSSQLSPLIVPLTGASSISGGSGGTSSITVGSGGGGGSLGNAASLASMNNLNYQNIGTSLGNVALNYPNTAWVGNTQLSVDGDADIKGDLKVKGKSILESLEKIEEKLAILKPNPELEEKWERLRQLRQEYIEVEKDIIEKEKLWDILKK